MESIRNANGRQTQAQMGGCCYERFAVAENQELDKEHPK
jgi:hypothetical protein